MRANAADERDSWDARELSDLAAAGRASEQPEDELIELRPYELGDELQCEVGGTQITGIEFTHQDKLYSSFQSIDWLADDARERAKLARMFARAAVTSSAGSSPLAWLSLIRALLPRAKIFIYNMQGWVCALLCGVLCGMLASFVAVTGGFLVDLREGYCRHAFWTPRRTCCLLTETIDGCDSWVSWAEALGAGANGLGAGAYFVNYLVYMGLSVSFAVLASFLSIGYAPYATGSGIQHIKVILSGVVIRKHLGKWTLLIKSLALPFAAASGLNLGKEGPFVHLAAGIGNVCATMFPRFDKVASKRREMVASVACAGVCVAFGAPIGGVLFVLEVMAYYFPSAVMWRGFVCSLAAASTLAVIDPFHTGKLVLFQLATGNVKWSWLELPVFVLVGVLGGLFGAAFCKVNLAIQAIRKHDRRLQANALVEVAVIAFVTAAMNYLSVFLRMDGISLLALLFRQCDRASDGSETLHCETDSSAVAVVSLMLAAALKLVMMCFTNGLMLPAGLFVPSMAAGACFGRAIGATVRAVLTHSGGLFGTYCVANAVCVDTSLYAICGAAAAIGGVTRMTVCLVVIMFEVTGGVTLLIPLMVSVGVAKIVADLWGEEDVYARMIRLAEFPYIDPKLDLGIHTPLADVMAAAANVVTVPEHGSTIDSLVTLLNSSSHNGFPVVSADGGLVGYVSRIDLAGVLQKAIVRINTERAVVFTSRVPRSVVADGFLDMRPYVDPTPVAVIHTTPFSTACDVLVKTGARYLIVLRHGKFASVVTRKDLAAYAQMARAQQNVGAR